MPAMLERNQSGKREDLADLIANVDCEETPLVSLLPKGKKPTNPLFEWQMDAYKEGSREGVPDGKDVDAISNQSEKRVMAQGRVHVFRESFGVGFIANSVTEVAGLPGGSKGEFTNQGRKALFVARRTIEQHMGSDDDSRPDDGVVGSKTRALGSWTSSVAQAELPVNENYRTPAAQIYTGTLANFDENALQALLNARWKQTKKRQRLVALVGISIKKKISDFTRWSEGVSTTVGAVRTFTQPAEARKVVATVDFYSGDGAELEIIPSAFLRAGGTAAQQDQAGYIFDPMMHELRYAELPAISPLENKGGGPKGFVQTIVGLVCNNPLGNCKINAT
jgi:hypothetical protein